MKKQRERTKKKNEPKRRKKTKKAQELIDIYGDVEFDYYVVEMGLDEYLSFMSSNPCIFAPIGKGGMRIALYKVGESVVLPTFNFRVQFDEPLYMTRLARLHLDEDSPIVSFLCDAGK